jgi:YihY family inner membrane protein
LRVRSGGRLAPKVYVGGGKISTATEVPETFRRRGDNPLDALKGIGWRRLAGDSVARFRAADGFSHSRALGYQITLTALPALIASVGLAAVVDWSGLRHALRSSLVAIAPGQTAKVFTTAIEQGSESGENALVVGLVAALVSGTFAMAQVERGANRIYGVERDRGTAQKYLRGFFLAITAGLLNVAAFVVLVAGPSIADAGRAGGWSEELVTAWQIARWPIGILLAVGGFALLFERSPKRNQPPARWLAAGSAVSVLLWFAFTGALALYLAASGGFGETYGPLAGMIGVLLWAFLSSVALYLGVAFAAQLEAVRAGVSQPTTNAEKNPRGQLSQA